MSADKYASQKGYVGVNVHGNIRVNSYTPESILAMQLMWLVQLKLVYISIMKATWIPNGSYQSYIYELPLYNLGQFFKISNSDGNKQWTSLSIEQLF